MIDTLALYQEGGMVLLVASMFFYLVYSMNARSSEQAKSLEELKIENEGQTKHIDEIIKEVDEQKQILIKLIDRFGRSDETSLAYRNDMMREVSDLSEKVSYMSGRLNGRGKHG